MVINRTASYRFSTNDFYLESTSNYSATNRIATRIILTKLCHTTMRFASELFLLESSERNF